ncbi:P-loop containing nucleoside triphosphate hydrolase protein [Cristinia sonorae]|uniref:P-loop containing nucleoside triphosphate hydrolase protein n=1 Tax=Cristinia sonorae TaxID=1940300 RepID=A0A8K0UR72_9AGAR|nr:P-loop containing nucleoside triphosphate hydrolase protein [Cristinia sonorae]
MPKPSSSTISNAKPTGLPKIHAISQQSRFHTETLETAQGEVDLKDVTISIGEKELIVDARLKLKAGVRYALVGRNGTGKSTLLQAVADKLIPGLSKSLGVLLVSQIEDGTQVSESEEETVLQHVVKGDKERMKAMREFEALTRAVESTKPAETQRILSEIRLARRRTELEDAQKIALRTSGARGKRAREDEIKAEERLKEAEEALAEGRADADAAGQVAEMLTDVTTTLELLDASTTEARAAVILTGLGFTQAMIDAPFVSLSGGWRSRCALATSLLVQSDILMLDEPSNFLDLEATLWLEHHLTSEFHDRTLVLTSHDQVFLNNVVEETIILRDKTLRYFEGTPRAFEIDQRKRRKAAIKTQSALDKKKEHVENSIRQGLVAGKSDPKKLKQVKSRQKKLDERWGLETSAKGTRFKLNRDMAGYFLNNRAEVNIEELESKVRITLPNPEKLRTLGELVSFENVGFRYPARSSKEPAKWVLDQVTFTVGQGGRCVFIGANGHGKSTLAKLILGELKPTKGVIQRHPLLKIGYFSQHTVEQLTKDGTNTTALAYFLKYFEERGETAVDSEARACLGTFGLGGKLSSDTPLTALSGGQKVRLAIALIVFRPPSLLLLDEITTHVDAPTIQSLARALRNFTGGIIMVTHDRWFSRVVIEGHSLSSAGAFGDDQEDDESDVSASEDEDEEGAGGPLGVTYYVGKGTIKKMEGGMGEYVKMVERRLERRAKKAAKGG